MQENTDQKMHLVPVCPYCGAAFIVEKAINEYNVQNALIEHADNVNVDHYDFNGGMVKPCFAVSV